jgi:hypothetical protein
MWTRYFVFFTAGKPSKEIREAHEAPRNEVNLAVPSSRPIKRIQKKCRAEHHADCARYAFRPSFDCGHGFQLRVVASSDPLLNDRPRCNPSSYRRERAGDAGDNGDNMTPKQRSAWARKLNKIRWAKVAAKAEAKAARATAAKARAA